jgi:hypothetical protein
VFTEHTQCLALLTSQLEPDKREKTAGALLKDPKILATTIYFTHYLFEAYRMLGLTDEFFKRLSLWLDLADLGFKTTYEFPEPTRSDCHGWGAHPIYHYFATILGIRPVDLGFKTVEIAPQLGPLTHASGYLIHQKGRIQVDFRQKEGILNAEINLPKDLGGILNVAGQSTPLRPGSQQCEAALPGRDHDE